MAGEKKIETSEVSTPTTNSRLSTNLPKKDMGKDGIPPESISSVSSGADDQPLTLEQGVYYPPTSCYDYYNPGQNGNSSHSDNKGSTNTSGDSYGQNASHLYYIPGYATYSTGFAGSDGKQLYTSPEYIQSSYGSEAFPSYTYDSTYANGSKSRSVKSAATNSSVNSNGYNVAKTPASKAQHPNSSRPIYQNQSFNPMNKFGGSGHVRGTQPSGNFSSLSNRNPRPFPQYGAYNYQPNSRPWNNSYKSRSRESNGATEQTRGPRAENRNEASKSPAEVSFTVVREKYNLQEFETVYENARFFVIKSYSEDDVHKCIKYDVWSSTPNGNQKLDAVFRETRESGKECPVFLFFSVNASGQFVGVAEMVGQVDFTKNMDFWQLDKWNGFFPLKWHIIKDVPNPQFRHIILENNENRAVTYSRDTQEIGLKQGLEMLSIFKNYTPKTCVLDDFNFYEDREKALKAKRATSRFINTDDEKVFEGGELGDASLAALTGKLSLDPRK